MGSYKYLVLSLLSLVLTIDVIAKERLIIAFAPENCANCNMLLPHFTADTNLRIIFVLKKHYQKDETKLNEKYLKYYRIDSIIYSDADFAKYSQGRGTTLSTANLAFSKSVLELKPNDLDIIEEFVLLENSKKKYFNPQNYSSCFVFDRRGELVYQNALYSSIDRQNLLTGETSRLFILDSIVLNKIYHQVYNDSNAYKLNLKYVKPHLMQNIAEIKSFYIDDDNSVYIGIQFYMAVPNKQVSDDNTNIGLNYTIIKLSQSNDFEIIYLRTLHELQNAIEKDKDAYLDPQFIYKLNNKYYSGYKDSVLINGRYIAGLDTYKVHPTFHHLPKIYGVGHLNIPYFSEGKFMLPLESNIYDQESNVVIPLNLFANPDIICDSKDPSSFRSIEFVINDFKSDEEHYYVIFRKRKQSDENKIVVIHKKSLEKKFSTIICKDRLPVLLNPYNYNTLLVPNGEQMDIVKYN